MDWKEYLISEGMISPLGSGKTVEYEGTTTIKKGDRNKYANGIAQKGSFKSLSALVEKVLKSLKALNITPVLGDEEWVGTFSGSPTTERNERVTIALIKDGKKVKNSELLINIYKLPQGTYELVSYLTQRGFRNHGQF